MSNLPRDPRVSGISRTTVDLTAHPDLVVIYLGMRVRTPRGLGTLRSLGKQIERAAEKMLAPVAVPVHKARNTF